MALEQAQAAAARREQEENARLKGQLSPPVASKPTPIPILRSRRKLYWVDKATNLPLRVENYEEQDGKWALTQRTDYVYEEQFPANLFDPQDLLRVGRQGVCETKVGALTFSVCHGMTGAADRQDGAGAVFFRMFS